MFTLDISDDDILEAQKRYLSHTDMRRKGNIPLFTGWNLQVEIMMYKSNEGVNWLCDNQCHADRNTFGLLMNYIFPERVIYIRYNPIAKISDMIEDSWNGDTIIIDTLHSTKGSKLYEFLETYKQEYPNIRHIWIFSNGFPLLSYIEQYLWHIWMIDSQDSLQYIPKEEVIRICEH